MLIAHQIALDPNNAQATCLARAAGVARFAYNWALTEWKRQYETCKLDPTRPKPSQAALRRQLNAIKSEQFSWMLEVTKNAPQMAIIQLGQTFQSFFAGRARYPQFREKSRHDRFSLSNDQFSLDASLAKSCRLPSRAWQSAGLSRAWSGTVAWPGRWPTWDSSSSGGNWTTRP
ncbi:transposase [Malikia sp.]|uniref:transposase n=1 Tax=Malikia sp. TaxID=2070706 RepID=UPI002631CB02|nr:transposase [Malikia sp.]MDD2729098.1 transposase [Malikia sp.]